MKCTSPLKASLDNEGSITFSQKKAIPGLEPFEIPCRRCISCRLGQAKEKAIRALHEARMHPESIFLTLTYSDEKLTSNKLVYRDFQLFMKKIRNSVPTNQKIPMVVTGEYGELSKRPHWHALIFNYYPNDAKHWRTTSLDHKVYTSDKITKMWGNGHAEFGDITIDSANYVSRYAAKKLVHGKDQEHDYQPIHKTSSKNAIGKKWIEKYWKQTFDHGYVVLPNGSTAAIPRYYVDWLKNNKPDEYVKYITTVREKNIKKAQEMARREEIDYLSNSFNKNCSGTAYPLTRLQVKNRIQERKFQRLQQHLKL